MHQFLCIWFTNVLVQEDCWLGGSLQMAWEAVSTTITRIMTTTLNETTTVNDKNRNAKTRSKNQEKQTLPLIGIVRLHHVRNNTCNEDEMMI